jgi:hypothetical protein
MAKGDTCARERVREALDAQWRLNPFRDAVIGKSLFEMEPDDWFERVEAREPGTDVGRDGKGESK